MSAQNPQREIHESLGTTPAAIDTALASRLSRTFRAAASRALPAVVYIAVTERQTLAERRGGRELFRWFFGDPEDAFPMPRETPRERTRRGQGSGFIFDDRGYILTNNHVVEGADRVRVRMMDGREFPATVVGRDPSTDIAVIKIDVPATETLPVAPVDESAELRIGQWVLALGNPLGLDFSVTAGIVSAKGRQLDARVEERFGAAALQSFIQTDAAINPGNSGGPLVNLRGQVVGVNTAILSRSGFFAGAGFAIPINLAMEVARDLIEYGEVRRARLGVYIRPVREADAAVYGLDRIHGALISGVPSGSPADEAGLRAGDVVLRAGDEPIENATELQAYIARQTPGEEISLTIMRDGEREEVDIELGQFRGPASGQQSPESRRSVADLLGFDARTLTPRMAERAGVEPGGAAVIDVERFSAAWRAGVRPGLIIVGMNGSSVEAAGDIEEVAEDIEAGDIISLRVRNPSLGNAGIMVINYRTRP